MENETVLKKEQLAALFTKYGRKFIIDEIIFKEGDTPDCFYIIFEGKVKIVKNDDKTQTILNVIENGELFGEISLIDKQERSATAIAISDCKLIMLNEEIFFELMKTQKSFIMNVLSTLVHRTKRISEIAVKLSKLDEKTRIMVSLSNIVKIKSDNTSNKVILSAAETIRDISLNINIDQEKIAKHLNELEQMNRISIKDNDIIINNIRKFHNFIGM